MRQNLDDYLAARRAEGLSEALADVLARTAAACVEISRVVTLGAIAGNLGSAGQINVQDEEQKQLDVITNDILTDALINTPFVAGVASEEMETVQPSAQPAGDEAYLVLFDPLDGSSNIDVNVSVGTIFSVLPAPAGKAPDEADFLQPGRNQAAAGYAIYGPQTMLVLTTGNGVVGFTLNPEDGGWRLTHETIKVPAQTKEFAINMSNIRHWAAPMRAYVEACLAGKTGARGKDFNMRWIASMVADVHRVLMRGGVFIYPWDQREPDRAGKLRLMYEANPMGFVVEQAGGLVSTTSQPILEIAPHTLHQRVPVALGSSEEVTEIVRLHAAGA